MRVIVITPPRPVVLLEEAKHHLHVDGDEDNILIEGLVAAATAHLDGPDGWLGRALGEQELEASGDLFSCITTQLPCPPVIEIVSVSYDDPAGIEQTIAGTAYRTLGARLVAAPGASWPTTGLGEESVRIRYRAGYPVVPAPIRAAILLTVEALYDSAPGAVVLPPAAGMLVQPFRVWR